MRKNNDGNNKKNVFIIVIVCILLLNSITIMGSFFILNKRINQLSAMVISGLKSQQPAEIKDKEIETVEISAPESSYQAAGNSDASVKMMVITDLECPFCKEFHKSFLPLLEQDFINRDLVQLTYMPFPIEEKHPKALPAAVALYCANEQGLFWPAFYYLSENIDKLSISKLKKIPPVEGINSEVFSECILEPEPEEEVHDIVKQLLAVGVNSTPTVIVDGKIIKGYTNSDGLFAYLDNELLLKSLVISPDDVKEAVATGNYIILDVRTAEEFSAGHLEGAINIDYLTPEKFTTKIAELPKDSNFIVYCKSGKRSTRAYHQMKAAGFLNVSNMAVGYDGWIRKMKMK